MYLEEKKKIQQLKKQQRASVRNVKISTPVQKQLRNKKENLLFEVSPIRPDDSGLLEEDKEESRGASLYEELRQIRLKEIEEREKARKLRKRPMQSNFIEQEEKPLEVAQTSPPKSPVDEQLQVVVNLADISEILPEPDESQFIYKRPKTYLTRKQRKIDKVGEGNSMNSQDWIKASMMNVPEINVSMVDDMEVEKSLSNVSIMQEDEKESQPNDPNPVQTKEIAKKSVAINLIPAVHNISSELILHPTTSKKSSMTKKSVGFSHATAYEENENNPPISLNPGKWRKSLIALRKSRYNEKPNVRRTSVILEESGSKYAEKVLNALGDCKYSASINCKNS